MSWVGHAIFNFTLQQQEARAFLRWLMDEKQLVAWYASADTYYQPVLHGYGNAPMWQVERRRNIPYRDSLATARLVGWAGAPSRQSAESVAKYVVVDMCAKACAGASTKEVLKNAEAQLKETYRIA
jgi:multiple sugar transport system substrate-binding protein